MNKVCHEGCIRGSGQETSTWDRSRGALRLRSTSAFPDEPELPPRTRYERLSKLIRSEARPPQLINEEAGKQSSRPKAGEP